MLDLTGGDVAAMAEITAAQEVILGQFSKIGARLLTADGQDLTSGDNDQRKPYVRGSVNA